MVSVEDGEAAIVVLSPIANPLATDKLAKKILKLVKAGNQSEISFVWNKKLILCALAASKAKSVRRGVKEVVKAVRTCMKYLFVGATDFSIMIRSVRARKAFV